MRTITICPKKEVRGRVLLIFVILRCNCVAHKSNFKFINDNNNAATLAFLEDIFQHINFFNLKFQGD